MNFLCNVLEILHLHMTTPTMYGWFHILFLIVTVVATVLLCKVVGKGNERKVVLITSIIVIVLEIYKQINYTFGVENGVITADYEWYAFPFQFCSTPMYIGLLAGVTKGKIHDALCAYLATFSVFAGLCVMLYPSTVFIGTIGINIQTMICHGSMIAVGVYLLYTNYVKSEHKTILKAIPVFAVLVCVAVVLNEIAHLTGLLETDTFNMFFISPYCEPSLPVYSLVQGVVAFPWCLFIYVGAFSLASYIILLISMIIKRLSKSNK